MNPPAQPARRERDAPAAEPGAAVGASDTDPAALQGEMQREMQRQTALLRALFDPRAACPAAAALGVDTTRLAWQAGLDAMRGNARSHAERALLAQFPTLLAMLGEAPMRALCAAYWRARPPRAGDLAGIGAEFPDYVGRLRRLRAWPWLRDSARLDWALWQLQYASAPRLDAQHLQALARHDPARLRLRLAQGVALLDARWPVVSLWQLHRGPEPDSGRLRQALGEGAQCAWAWRGAEGPRCEPLGRAERRWLRALQRGASVAAALRSAGPGWDFAAWLQRAVLEGWLDGIEPCLA